MGRESCTILRVRFTRKLAMFLNEMYLNFNHLNFVKHVLLFNSLKVFPVSDRIHNIQTTIQSTQDIMCDV